MKNLSSIAILIVTLIGAGCSDGSSKPKREFVAGCVQAGGDKSICSCNFDLLEKTYAPDEILDLFHILKSSYPQSDADRARVEEFVERGFENSLKCTINPKGSASTKLGEGVGLEKGVRDALVRGRESGGMREVEKPIKRQAQSEEEEDVVDSLERLEEEDEKRQPGMALSEEQIRQQRASSYSMYKEAMGDYKAPKESPKKTIENPPSEVDVVDQTSAVRDIVASSTYASPRPTRSDVVRSTAQSGSAKPAASNKPKGQEREVAVSSAPERNSPPVPMPKADPFNRTAVINDPDGYTNVRIEASGKGKIISRILQNERFYTYEQPGSWWAVRKTDGLLGYVHKSRITLLP